MGKDILLIDTAPEPVISDTEIQKARDLQKSFMEDYIARKDTMSLQDWLVQKLSEELPDTSKEEIQKTAEHILLVQGMQQKKREELQKWTTAGRSKETWLHREMKDVTKAMSPEEQKEFVSAVYSGLAKENVMAAEHTDLMLSAEQYDEERNSPSKEGTSEIVHDALHMSGQHAADYMKGLDDAIIQSNEAFQATIHTKTGGVNQNPQLDGFLAEKHHATTFNMNAAAKNSPYRAKVLEPTDGTYGKNSVDLEIYDTRTGKVVRRYQSKYCKDAEATSKAFEKGDYRGQRKLTPADQTGEVPKASDRIEGPDGTHSNPLTKKEAKAMQREAQEGRWQEKNWDDYAMGDLAKGIAKQAGYAAGLGAAMGGGIHILKKMWNGEEIKGDEVVETMIKTGGTAGLQAAAAGALTVGVKKGVISCIPKGTPAGVIAGAVSVGIESMETIDRMVDGKISMREGAEQLEQNIISTTAGMAAAASVTGGASGVAAGAAALFGSSSAVATSVGTVAATLGQAGTLIAGAAACLGPVGVAAAGLAAGAVAYTAGSKVVKGAVKAMQTVRRVAYSGIKAVAKAAGCVARGVCHAVSSMASGLASFFGF